MKHQFKFLTLFTLLILVLAACAAPQPSEPADTESTEEEMTEEEGAESEEMAEEEGAESEEMAEEETDVMTDTTETEAMTDTAEAAVEPVADLGGRTLIIGSDTTYPPMEYIDEDTQEIVGFDVDMMNAIAPLINAQIEFETFPNFDAIFAALANGEFDMVVSSVSVTEERDEIIDFSNPYLNIGQVISVQADNETIVSADDLASAELVGVQGGTTGEEAAREAGVSDEQIKRYDTIDLAFQDLANGALDAVVADGPPSAQYTAQLEGQVRVIGEPFTTEDYAIALQEGDTELQEAINAALQELKDNGTLEELMAKWNLQDVATLP
jgi:polar amino acid transport system substrate-binding protein